MTTNFRHAIPEEAGELAHFAAAMFIEAYRDQSPLADLEAYVASRLTRDCVLDEITAPLTAFLVAEVDGMVAAYALICFESAPDCELVAGAPAEIRRFYVDPAWHGRGLARELMGRCLCEAVTAGCDVVWLSVWDANPRAIRFYQKSGFQVVGEQGFQLGDDLQRDFVMAWPGNA